VMVEVGSNPHVVAENGLSAWKNDGYENPKKLPMELDVMVLTPRSVVNGIEAGFDSKTSALRAQKSFG